MIFHSLPPAACWIVLLTGKVGILLAINATCPDKSTIPSPLQAGFPHNSAQDGQSCPVAKKSQGRHLSNEEKKPYNILSLDGGGSRGAMEALILKDVMACLTLVQRGQLEADEVDFAAEEARKRMREQLDGVEDALHPGDVFKMIAGTSTGGLMAFGLLHGKDGGRMSVEEVVEMYEEHTQTIFPSWIRSLTSWWPEVLTPFTWPGSPLGVPYPPYSQEGLEKVLLEKFGELKTKDVRRQDEKCIAAAVARRHNPPHVPRLEIFDTFSNNTDIKSMYKPYSEENHRLVEVLKASACAPVYFRAPTSIGGVDYIDGGVGGNCPLTQAIPRMRKIADKGSYLQTVLSISPPRESDTKGEKSLQQWLKWFPTQLADGYPVYLDQERANLFFTFIFI